MLDPRRLLLLVDVVRAGSITSAASRLNYTTSAVSQQISKLETEAGQPLLERHARGVRLTEAGAALVRRAERIETQLLAAGTELDDIAGLRSGTVRLGTFPTAGSSLLPPVVKLFKSRHPAIGLTVRSSRFAQLRAMLDAREIEISLLWDYAWDPVNDPELTVRVLIIDPPTLVVSGNHRLAKRKKISMGELADEQWITREDTILSVWHWRKPVMLRDSHPPSPSRPTTIRRPKQWWPSTSVSRSRRGWHCRIYATMSVSSRSSAEHRRVEFSWHTSPINARHPPLKP